MMFSWLSVGFGPRRGSTRDRSATTFASDSVGCEIVNGDWWSFPRGIVSIGFVDRFDCLEEGRAANVRARVIEISSGLWEIEIVLQTPITRFIVYIFL